MNIYKKIGINDLDIFISNFKCLISTDKNREQVKLALISLLREISLEEEVSVGDTICSAISESFEADSVFLLVRSKKMKEICQYGYLPIGAKLIFENK